MDTLREAVSAKVYTINGFVSAKVNTISGAVSTESRQHGYSCKLLNVHQRVVCFKVDDGKSARS